jgi:hypothetical protein
MNARQRWLALALAVTVIVAFWPERGDDVDEGEVVQAEKPRQPAVAKAAKPAGPGLPGPKAPEGLERFAAKADGDLFPSQTWVPPPPPPPKVKPLPPPPPSPPPLPFSYLGHWAEAGQETFFLAQGDRVDQVRQGDVIAGSWRLDEVSPSQLVFTYLPLDMTRTLRITP